MSRSRLTELARAAQRPDIAAEIEALDPALEEAHLVAHFRPRRRSYQTSRLAVLHEIEMERWDLPRRPVWLVTIGAGGLSGGEGWAYEEIVLTEYDMSDESVAAAVLEVLRWETPFTSEWAATNSQYRLRHDGAEQLVQRRDELAERMHRWVDAVTALRKVDPRPAPPPIMGGREL